MVPEMDFLRVSGTAGALKAASPRDHVAGKVAGPWQQQMDRRWVGDTEIATPYRMKLDIY